MTSEGLHKQCGCRRQRGLQEEPAGRQERGVRGSLLRTWPWAAASADGVVRKAVRVDWHRPSPSQIGYQTLVPSVAVTWRGQLCPSAVCADPDLPALAARSGRCGSGRLHVWR